MVKDHESCSTSVFLTCDNIQETCDLYRKTGFFLTFSYRRLSRIFSNVYESSRHGPLTKPGSDGAAH
jgi:hypothetical protein